MTAIPSSADARQTTVGTVLYALAISHLLNDTMQSLIPASYPLLKENLALSFTQIGLITLVFQGTASILQPLVGFYTDRRPLPYAASCSMAATALGLLLLASATSFWMVLLAVGLTGIGSAVFHPEASRMVRLAAGKRPGFGQSLFQLGGNAGTALGPLAAVFIVLRHGQDSISWFALLAVLSIVLLYGVARWYFAEGAERALARRKAGHNGKLIAPAKVRLGMAVLIVLMISKFFYSAVNSNYLTFYLIEEFGLSKSDATYCLFVYLGAVAAGTLLGGPIGDRIGRQRVILVSILGILPITLLLPHVPLVLNVPLSALAGFMLASAFPAMVVYAQDLLPKHTGMVAGLLFGLAFGFAAIGAAGLGMIADRYGIRAVYEIGAVLPLLGLAGFWLPKIDD